MDTYTHLSELTLQDVPYILRKRIGLLAALTLLGAGLGAFKAITSPRFSRADAVIQVPDYGRTNMASAEISQLTEALSLTNPIEGEIEIARSRMVLGQVVKKRSLNVGLWPDRTLKDRLLRKPVAQVDLGYFRVPYQEIGVVFQLKFLDSSGAFVLTDPRTRREILRGRPGEAIDSIVNPWNIGLLVDSIHGAVPGESYSLVYSDDQAAIDQLRYQMSAEQVGKNTGLFTLSVFGYNPEQTAQLVNDIAEAYVNQNVERRSKEAEQRTEFLLTQLPAIKAAVDSCERRLGSLGSNDPNRQLDQVLGQQSNISQKMLELQQQRKEALGKFRPDHPNVRYFDDALAILATQERQLRGQMSGLSSQQQRADQLQRDLQSATDRYTKILDEIHQLQAVSNQKVGDVRIVDLALRGSVPMGKGLAKLVMVGGIVGFLLGSLIAIVWKIVFFKVESPNQIEALLGRAVLTNLPHSSMQAMLAKRIRKGEKGVHLLVLRSPEELATESLRNAQPSIRSFIKQSGDNVVMFAGAAPGSGRTFVCANFAVQLAQTGAKVLLIDADIRKGMVHKLVDGPQENGLAEVLSGTCKLDSALKETRIPNLSVLPCGAHTNKSTVLLQGQAFAELLASLKASYGYVVIDTPPLLALSDGIEIAHHCGTIILVLKHAKHTTAELEACRKRLSLVEQKFCGIIFNDVDPRAPINGSPLHKQIYKYTTG